MYHRYWKDDSDIKTICCSCKGVGLVPRTHMVTHNHPLLQLQGIQCLLMNSVEIRHAYGTHSYTQANTHKHKR